MQRIIERKFKEFIALGEVDPRRWLIAYYYLEGSKGFSPLDVAAAIAAEESIGTWTKVKAEEKARKLAGRVIEVKGNLAKVAFPLELFELGNIPQLLSVIAGNLFGLKAIKNVRLLDVSLPRKYLRAFRGPKFGVRGVRKIVGTLKEGRPHVGTIVKPKVGLSPKATARVAYEAGIGGIDHIKDDETLTNQKFCPVEKRLVEVMKALGRVEKQTGKNVLYTINVTHDSARIIERAEKLVKIGANALMIDVITCGFSALKELREAKLRVPIHVHRCMHAAFTRNPKHGISMCLISKLVRLAGGDQLHVGTVIGKMHGEAKEVIGSANVCREKVTEGMERINLEQRWFDIKPVLPISSGGLHPGLIPRLMKIMGRDFGMQFGGGIHGHPLGTRAGAIAVRQAIAATMKGIPLKRYAAKHEELAIALKKWGFFRPRA